MKEKNNGLLKAGHVVVMVLLLSFCIFTQGRVNGPVTVSPGSDTEVTTIWQPCPTFSWSSVAEAASYRIAVFQAMEGQWLSYEEMNSLSSPVIGKDMAGTALSCSLSVEERLQNHTIYIWYVQALDTNGQPLSVWSHGRLFKVEPDTTWRGMEEKLGSLLKTYGVSESIITNLMEDLNSGNRGVVSGVKKEDNPLRSGVKGYEGTTNTFYGLNAGAATTGSFNSFFGAGAGQNNTSGYGNNFFGLQAGYNNTTGYSNLFLGQMTGHYNTAGMENSFVGVRAGCQNTTGAYNSFVGTNAGYSNQTGNSNSFLGYYAGFSNTNGASNCFMGDNAGYRNSAGNQNVFIGTGAGFQNTTGSTNTFIGRYTGYNNTTGTGNIFLGYRAGFSEFSSNRLFIDNSDTSSPLIYGEMDNRIVTVHGKLGINTKTPIYVIEADTTGINATIVAKRTDGVTSYMHATTTYAQFGSITNHPVRLMVNAVWKLNLSSDGSLSMANGATCTAGGVWTNASSRALKENIQTLDSAKAMATIAALTPVTYNYKSDKSDSYVGFIAEDVPELVATADRKGLSPMDITAVLTKVVQEQQQVNLQQQAMIQQQYRLLKEQQKVIAKIQKRMAQLEKK